MKSIRLLALILPFFFMFSCQTQSSMQVTIIDGEQIKVIQTTHRMPQLIISQAGFTFMPDDRVFLNGILIPLDQPLPQTASAILQLHHAVSLNLITPNGQQSIRTAARTVGEALYSTGLLISSADLIDPPVDTPAAGPLTITFTPARELTVSVDGKTLQIKSTAPTVGQALARVGIPLLGLDYSLPSEGEALPDDGRIQVVHVNETVTYTLKPIPYTTETMPSADLELGQLKIITPGINGIALSRTRIRYENGKEVKRHVETDTVMRPPQTQVENSGTKLVSHTIPTDIGSLQYWYSVPMYATSYSPCRSGISGCSYATASGLRAQYGVVAMSKDWYYALQGMEVFIPGYGRAIIGDIGGGFPDGRAWIDLGYNEDDYQEWSEWVTVYFLGSPPAEIPYILK